jgi:hypothetical protein
MAYRDRLMGRMAWVVVAAATTLLSVLAMAGPAAAATAMLSGRVTDGIGTPLANSTIAIETAGTTNQIAATTTALDGSYSVSVEAGSYDVHVIPSVVSGFNPATFGNFAISGATDLDVVLTDATTVTLNGVVRDPLGNPVPGVRLDLNNGNNGSVTTDASGAFAFQTSPGTYPLQVLGSGGTGSARVPSNFDLSTTVTVSGDTTQDLTIPAVVVDVLVVGPSETPVPGTGVVAGEDSGKISLYPGDTHGSVENILSSSTTDATGHARIILLATAGSGTADFFATPPTGSGLSSTQLGIPNPTQDTTLAIVLQSLIVKAQPSISTTASGEATVGGAIHDTAMLLGGSSPTGTISFQLYASSDKACSIPIGSPVAAEVNKGNGEYKSSQVTESTPGSYQWVASYSGDAINESAQSACNDAKEQVMVAATAPTVTRVEPVDGPAAGGTLVAITGTGFSGASAVKFGSANATSFTVNSEDSITATSPLGSGTVDVTVSTLGATSATNAADRFTYLDPTATTVECTPSSLPAEAQSTCKATVSDSSSQSTPSGIVSFSSSGSGGFSGGASCTLSQITVGVAACSLTYTPSGTPATPVRIETMTAIYGGDPLHTESNGSASMEVITPHSSATAVECTPGSLLAGSQSICKATVSDTANSGQSTSTGTVSLKTSGSGSFSDGASCTLSESAAGVASCIVTYTPNGSAATQLRTDTITATYAGDPLHNESNGSASVEVTTQHASVGAVECAPSSLEAGSQSTTCTVTVTDSASVALSTPTGAASFRTSGSGSFSGGTSCTLSESAAGVASCIVTYTPNGSAATQLRTDTITVAYSGDTLHTESNGATTVEVVTPHSSATTIQCVPSSLVAEGQSTCTAKVADSATSSLSEPTGTVSFSSSGPGSFSISGKCVLSQSGLLMGEASCSLAYTPGATQPSQVRHDNITALYGGDTLHNESSGATIAEVITPHPTATALECRPSSVVAGSQSTCKVMVSDAAGVAQSTPTGKVSFSSSGPGSFSDSAECTLGERSGGVGICSVTYTPGGTPATQVRSDTLTASYGADRLHTESSDAGSVQVLTLHPSATAVTCSPNNYVVAGKQTTCTATVTDIAGAASSMPTGTISLSSSGSGSFSGAGKCTLTESSSGVATCSLTYMPTATPATPARFDIITAAYDGDSLHMLSNGTAAEQVLSITLLSSGSFVIGDQSAKVGTAVTFWGRQWWKLNSLSGGAAPSSFKGFASSMPNDPPYCGDRWTSATGNVSNPPSSVPSLMAVIASSSITESGETISGNAPQVVIVKTNSDYAPNPGHAGTGTVVARVCP